MTTTASQQSSIILYTIDLEPIINETEWMQDEVGEDAMDLIYAIEDQAGDYLSVEDEHHVTLVTLDADLMTLLRRVMADIEVEEYVP